MKMFKKLMAVALTAVMAVSMLTGCSFADTFFRIPLIRQNVPGSGKTQLSIGSPGSVNGCLVPLVEKR